MAEAAISAAFKGIRPANVTSIMSNVTEAIKEVNAD